MQNLVNVLVIAHLNRHTGIAFSAVECGRWRTNATDSTLLAMINLFVGSIIEEFADMAEVASERDLTFDAHLRNRLKRITLHTKHLFGRVSVNLMSSHLLVMA